MERGRQRAVSSNRPIFVSVEKRRVKLVAFMKQWRRVEGYTSGTAHRAQPAVRRAEREVARLCKRLAKAERERDDALAERDEALTDRDDANAKREKVIGLLGEAVAGGAGEEEDDDVGSRQEEEGPVSSEAVATAGEGEVMMEEKVSVEDDGSQMSEVFDVENSAERASAKLVIDDTTTSSGTSENSSSDSEESSG